MVVLFLASDSLILFSLHHLYLQHTNVLQAHYAEHSDRQFSSSQYTNLQYTYW
jgi:hypothetical protein